MRRGSSAIRSLVTFVMIVPVLEEVLYRGHLLDAFTRAFGTRLALAGSSALFALGHFRSEVMPVAFAGGLLCGAVALSVSPDHVHAMPRA